MSNQNAPIQITLYDPETNEVKAEHSRVFVPWAVLKRAVRLMKGLDTQNMTEEDVDTMAGIVCEAFGNKFSVQDLSDGADVGEMMAVIQQVIARASFQRGGRGVGRGGEEEKRRKGDEGKGERPLPVMMQEE